MKLYDYVTRKAPEWDTNAGPRGECIPGEIGQIIGLIPPGGVKVYWLNGPKSGPEMPDQHYLVADLIRVSEGDADPFVLLIDELEAAFNWLHYPFKDLEEMEEYEGLLDIGGHIAKRIAAALTAEDRRWLMLAIRCMKRRTRKQTQVETWREQE